MAPSRPRVPDDSRSETSSTITNLKDRSILGSMASLHVSKGKRAAPSTHNLSNGVVSTTKVVPNGNMAMTPMDPDPNLPRIQWHTLPTSILHTYRYAHRLPTSSAHTNPHADLIFASSRTGLRSPSAVISRRKIRDAKHHARRKNGSSTGNSKSKDRERSSDRLKGIIASNNTYGSSSTQGLTGAEDKQTHSQLATAIRRHFNSQQVSESDVIAKFAYVVRHSASAARTGGTVGAVGIKGSKVMGVGATEADAGWEMGTGGREEDRKRDIGFRLRFRP